MGGKLWWKWRNWKKALQQRRQGRENSVKGFIQAVMPYG